MSVIKIDRTVLKETRLALLFTAVGVLLMNAVFLVLSGWTAKVLWGSLLGFTGASLDFFLMGLGVQKAVSSEEKAAKNIIRLSQQGRLLMVAAFLVIAFAVPVFDRIAAVLPLFFPKLGIRLRAFFDPSLRTSARQGADDPSLSLENAENGGDEP